MSAKPTRVLTAALAAAFTVALCAPARADDADSVSLLAKHRAFAGWQFGDGTFNSMQLSGHLASGDRTLERFTTVQLGGLYRTTFLSQSTGLTTANGFTGNVFWWSDENGFTRPDYSDYRKFSVSEYVLLNEGTTLLTGDSRGPGMVGSATYPIVRVTPPNGDSIDLYIDAATGAYVRAVIDPGGKDETRYDIASYSEILPGKRYVQKYSVDGSSESYVFDKIQPNAPVTADDLHPPAAQAAWTFANHNPFHVDVKGHAIFVNASVNGVKGRFILDTGAGDIYLTNEFADRAHLATIGTSSAGGLGSNTVRTRLRRADAFTIGGNTLSNVIVATGAVDLTTDDERPDGLIGFPLFAGAVVTLNTSDQLMTLADSSAGAPDQNAGVPLRVDLSSSTPVVPMTINGHITVDALLDMGDGSFVVMSPQLVSKRGIPNLSHGDTGGVFYHPEDTTNVSDYVNSHVVVTGIGGQEVESCSTVASIAIGPIVYQGTYYCVSPEVKGDNIIVGYDFLRHFDFVFDYPAGLLVLKPHAT